MEHIQYINPVLSLITLNRYLTSKHPALKHINTDEKETKTPNPQLHLKRSPATGPRKHPPVQSRQQKHKKKV